MAEGKSTKQRRKRRRFTDEFKAATVQRVLSGTKTAGQVARELDLTETAVRSWVKQARVDGGKGPAGVSFKKPWELADDMLRHVGPRLPHRWVVGDAEFGRSTAFRDRLAKRGERYVLEVPSTIVVRKVARPGVGRPPTWHRVSYFLRRRDIREWKRFTVRDGQKEPIEVVALAIRVQTRRHGKSKEETLLAIEALGSDERWLFVSNAPRHTPLEELVRAASRRHLVEEAFENAKGEVGLDHHEVRAWRGWHHHMTASLMALWFLVRERRRLGEKSTTLGGDGALHDLRVAAPAPLAEGDRRPLPLSDEAQRGGPHQPLEGAWPEAPVVEAWALPRTVELRSPGVAPPASASSRWREKRRDATSVAFGSWLRHRTVAGPAMTSIIPR